MGSTPILPTNTFFNPPYFVPLVPFMGQVWDARARKIFDFLKLFKKTIDIFIILWYNIYRKTKGDIKMKVLNMNILELVEYYMTEYDMNEEDAWLQAEIDFNIHRD